MSNLPGLQRFAKYSVIGGGTFLFDLLLLALFIDILSINYLIAAGLAFLIAVSINYLLSRRWVFKNSKRKAGLGYIYFIIIAGEGLFIVVLGMYLLVSIIGVGYLLARVAIASFAGLFNYLLNLHLNFKVAGKHQFE